MFCISKLVKMVEKIQEENIFSRCQLLKYRRGINCFSTQ